MKLIVFWTTALLATLLFAQSYSPPECEWCAVNEVPANATAKMDIAPVGEPGRRLLLTGVVYQNDGKSPARDVVMYCYHTNAKGIYPKRGSEDRSSHAWWHGYLRGWLRTDSLGRYTLRTILPAAYPGGSEPAHIHCILKPPKSAQGYYIEDFVFKTDPLLTDAYWERVKRFGGEAYGGISLRDSSGVLIGHRDIRLK